jgi:hypothetical protein
MDEIVAAALLKWPNVPDCHGWLALDARGTWWMRDALTQAMGLFPQVKGSPVINERLLGFIGRNYLRHADAQGDKRWYFQNGPQRVWVELEAAPWVVRVQRFEAGGFGLQSHTGAPVDTVESAWVDEQGRLFVDFLGPDAPTPQFGLIHSLDVEAAADAIGYFGWPLAETDFETLINTRRLVLRP